MVSPFWTKEAARWSLNLLQGCSSLVLKNSAHSQLNSLQFCLRSSFPSPFSSVQTEFSCWASWLNPWCIHILNSLSKGCSDIPSVFSPKHIFSFFAIWIGWKFFKSLVLLPFCLTISSLFLASHILLQAVRKSQAAHSTFWLEIVSAKYSILLLPSSTFTK